MTTMKLLTIGLALLMALQVCSFSGAGTEDAGGLDEVYAITTDEGSVEDPGMLGGGDYFFVRFGRDGGGLDTFFGLIWGTHETMNTISVVTVQARYLGMADIRGEEDNEIRRPLKVHTLHALRLGSLIEFDDLNGNGLADLGYTDMGDENSGMNLSEDDRFFNKRVPMFGAWETEGHVDHGTDENGERHWSIVLTAENMSYRKIRPLKPWAEGDENITGEVLDRVTFTFHLYARLEEVNGITIPRWTVQVTRRAGPGENWNILSVDNQDPITDASGKRAGYRIKWDKEILGWNFNPNNVNRTLFLETLTIMGNHIPLTMARWMVQNQDGFMGRLGEEGGFSYLHDDGLEQGNGSSQVHQSPRLVRGNRIDYGGEWSRIARFTWVSNVTVDDEEREMHLQVHGGVRLNAVGFRGAFFRGFLLRAGMVFPGGDHIFHDPAVDGEVYLDIGSTTTDDTTTGPFRGRIVVIGALLAVVVVAVIHLSSRYGKRPRGYHDLYERPRDDANSWDRYYQR